jgi:hypothetical protein
MLYFNATNALIVLITMLLVALTKAVLYKLIIVNDINGGVEMQGLPQTLLSCQFCSFDPL